VWADGTGSAGLPAGLTFQGSPSWVGNGQVVLSGWHQAPDKYTFGNPSVTNWMPWSGADADDPSISRDTLKLATDWAGDPLTGQLPTEVRIYSTNGGPPNQPIEHCAATGTQFVAPVWSPDGGSLAWTEPNGIWEATFRGDITANDSRVSWTFIGVGNMPSWGPFVWANPPPSRQSRSRLRPSWGAVGTTSTMKFKVTLSAANAIAYRQLP
jgi:hypothetical protein